MSEPKLPASGLAADALRPLAQHTRGPWDWHWRFENGEANGSVFAEPIKGHAYAVAICPRYQKEPQWEADARLIAAAPDMHAMLSDPDWAALDAAIERFSAGTDSPLVALGTIGIIALRLDHKRTAALTKASPDLRGEGV